MAGCGGGQRLDRKYVWLWKSSGGMAYQKLGNFRNQRSDAVQRRGYEVDLQQKNRRNGRYLYRESRQCGKTDRPVSARDDERWWWRRPGKRHRRYSGSD